MRTTPAGTQIAVLPALSPGDRHRVQRLADAATEADGVRPLNEHVMLQLRYDGGAAVRHVVATAADGEWVGYGHLDLSDRIQGASAEVVVHPDHRRNGIGAALVQAMLA
ncbi:MAG: GNAT family N-acetyltransferase, partial [Nocardioidaceae bacterium]